VQEAAELAGVDPSATLDEPSLRLPWYSRSIDSTYLTGKRVFIYGDATHAIASARIAKEELGFEVVGLGTYSRELARAVRAEAKRYDLTALITEDHLAVEEAIAEARPELVLGTQMERHISKRLGLPCAVISAPVHVHDYPARYSPLMGFEGANVIFDTWVHPLMMGLEEHLLGMFRDDFEFADGAAPSHLGHVGGPLEDASIAYTSVASHDLAHRATEPELSPVENPTPVPSGATPEWTAEAAKELKKIPFFVRGKARRNTEQFARERSYQPITLETLYEAKAHFQGR
jgi:light-independent protochlorophyllide reductase subunit B